jgi:zinc protease
MITKQIIIRALMLLALFWSITTKAAPEIQHWTTDKGLKVYYVHAPQLPMVDMRLVYSAGSARDADKAGTALLTNALITMGADGLDADQLAEQFESVGAVTSSGAARDMAWFTLRTLTLPDAKKTAIEAWLKVLGQPDFPEKDFARLKKQTLVGLQAEKQSPSAVASKIFFKNLFGDHPYASPKNGTEESINALTLDDIKAFYQKNYVAKNAVLAMVGNVDKAEAETLANNISSVLQAGDKPENIPPVQPLTDSKTIKIPFPSQQAHIMIGQVGDKRGDKDYFTLYLGNHIMGGGGFTSHLMKEIRDERGLAYSAYSYFSAMKENGPFVLSLQTKLSQTEEAVSVARDVVKSFRENGPTDEELIGAKKDVNGGFPLNVASNADIVEYIAMIGFYDLPLDYLDAFTGKIDAITKEQIKDAFQRRVHPDKMLTVIVGGADEAEGSDEKEAKPASEK